MCTKPRLWKGLIYSGLILLGLVGILMGCKAIKVKESSPIAPAALLPGASYTVIPTSTATKDRLAMPALPANPNQFEQGRYLYWLNCMACHGDKGQGLTEEFRSLYVEDQNCWGRGCHGGRIGDQGFPIPTTVPAIISPTDALAKFATPDQLFAFLRHTHPPQSPGILPENQYWAITDYLLVENGRLTEGKVLEPQK
jgi:mono/diheme cytochrome c family protein